MTRVTRSVFVLRTPIATSDTVNVLIALKIIIILMMMTMMATLHCNLSHLAAVFRKVNASSKHSTNVSMTLVKSFLDDCLEMFGKQNVEWRVAKLLLPG